MRSRRNTGITDGNVRAGRPRTLVEHLDDAELVDEQRGSPLCRQSLKSPAMMSGASSGTVARIRSHSAWICHCRPRSNRPRWTLRQCSSGSPRPSLIVAVEQAAAFEQRARRCRGSPARRSGSATAPRCRDGRGAIDGVLAVGDLVPDRVGDELVLRLAPASRRCRAGVPAVHAHALPAAAGCRRRGRAAARAAHGSPCGD